MQINPTPERTLVTRQKSLTGAADNAAVVFTITASSLECWVLTALDFAFSADPPGAVNLTVVVGGVTIFQTKVVKSGPGPLKFPEGLHHDGAKNEAMVITLAASGAGGNVGTLNVRYC